MAIERICSDIKAPVEQASWIEAPFNGSALFQLTMQIAEPVDAILAFAAIPSYRIVLDGQIVQASSLQYTAEQVFYEPYRITLLPGAHVLEVLVIDYQGHGPLSRLDRKRGLYCVAYDAKGVQFNTGKAAWKCRTDCRFTFSSQDIGTYQCVSGMLTANYRSPQSGNEWQTPVICEAGADAWMFRQTNVNCRRLSPAPLPAFCHEPITRYEIRHVDEGGAEYNSANHLELPDPFDVPVHTSRRILIKLDNYYCADYEMMVDGGNDGEIDISWAESLYLPDGRKDNRNEIQNRRFIGLKDRFLPGSGLNHFHNIDYRAGRFVELKVNTGNEPLKITDLKFYENRYPLKWEGSIETGDSALDELCGMAFRTLQMCSHDTFMDCPYFEQLMYSGDGRLQALTAYVTSGDLRLVDHAILLWGEGLRNEGLFVSIYPARACQIIPSFSMIYIATVADYIRWRNLPEVTNRIFPLAVRSLMALESMINKEGLFACERGWLFVDWAKNWQQGVPPNKDGVSCIFNALYLYILREFAEACEMLGEIELCARFRKKAKTLYARVFDVFYRNDKAAFSDLSGEDVFSEHANALMLLSGQLPDNIASSLSKTLFDHKIAMTRTTVYFSFYYMEAAFRSRRPDAFFERLGLWRDMQALGLKTLLESPEPSRSDCHAWSSHILYHMYASVAGIRPGISGIYECDPQIAQLKSISGTMPAGSRTLSFHIKRGNDGIEHSMKYVD